MNSCGVRLWNFRALAVSIGLTLCGVHVPVSAQSAPINQAEHKLDTALRQKIKKIKRGQRHEPLRVIVRVKPKAIAQAQGMFKARGHAVRRFHRLFRTFVIDSRNIDELAQHPAIESISTDADLQADIDSPIVTNSLLSRTVGAPSSWTGAGIGVAVIDSGLEPSADFGARIPAFYDFTRGRIATAPYDDYGHGTHVAGLIGGSGVLSSGACAQRQIRGAQGSQ